MDKFTMAHEWAMQQQRMFGINIATAAKKGWEYVDAMQAEAEKREPKGFPDSIEEWQPDWSQAPDTAIAWEIRYGSDCEARWIHDQTLTGYKYSRAPSFNYSGDWKDSLRERPNNG